MQPRAINLSIPAKISFLLIGLLFLLTPAFGFATPLLGALFSYLIVDKLRFVRSKWLAIVLFSLLAIAAATGFGYFLRQAFGSLPKIIDTSVPKIVEFVDTSVPKVVNFAVEHNITLPFDNPTTFKEFLIKFTGEQLNFLGSFARLASHQFIFLLFGILIALGIFITPNVDLDPEAHPVRNNLYSATTAEAIVRFRNLYRSFVTVMGGQLLISIINTAVTGIFLWIVDLPYVPVILGVTFLCGLIPIIGNLISNTVITAVGFTVSPKIAIAALIFLVVLHKLGYFLNSKIIGDCIKSPAWLTLLCLLLGERLMGIPGMILAPVFLYYIKLEAGAIESPAQKQPESAPALTAQSG